MSKIAVDDGHGKETAGKRSPDGTLRENYFNDAVKQYLIAELVRNNFSYVDCSPGTSDNSLSDRTNRANNAKADIFVSIHANAFGDGVTFNDAKGIETFYYPGSTKGKDLANKIQTQLIKGTKQVNRGIKSANFHVLRETNMPAVLIEAGFMTNREELALLKKESYRKEVAIEICKGICSYFGKTYKEATNSSEKAKYFVQCGAFSNKKNAETLVEKLKKAGFDAIIKT